MSLFGAAATTVVGTACTAGIAAYSAPASRDVDGRSTCRQCSRVGLEAECLDLLDAGGSSSVGTVADVCRARFRNERGYARRKILDPSSPSWTAGLGDGASSLVSDTVTQFEAYPSMEAFDRAAASAKIILESEFVISGAVQYVAGLHRQLGDVKKTRGIPHETSGSTSRRAEWPYPHIQDECRGPVDLQSGGGGFALLKLDHRASFDQVLRVRMCGTTFPSVVGVYRADYADVPSSNYSVNAGTQDITLTFAPWKNTPTRYEVRLVYTTTATGTETYNASYVVGGATTILGDYELKKPELTRGSAGFETEPLSSGADVTVTLAAASASHDVTIVSATVRAANPAQVSRGFPPYAGYAQTTCGVFDSGRCGDMTFTAEADSEYFISITGKGAAEGAYSFQMMKMYGAVTTLRATSDNPALSVVASNDGTVERRIGGKLAKIGDVLTIEVTSGRVIDKPVIEVNGVVVQPGLVVGSGRSWEATFTVRRAHGFADGQLNVTANPPSVLTDQKRGFVGTEFPQGADKALVIFDGTPPTMVNVLAVNPAYLEALNRNAPDACVDSDDVKVTKAKAANVGSTVVVVFHASEPVLNVRATIGGLNAIVLMGTADDAPDDVESTRDAWRAILTADASAASAPVSDDTFGVAYATLTTDVVQQGNLAFEISYTDAAGNPGAPQTTIVGAPARVSPASSLTDRLRADFVEFDSFKPRDAGAATLRYASADEEEANDPDVAAAFQAVGEVTDGALSYRLGDTVIADVSWNEAVTRPYGAYFQLAANRKQHVKQSDVTLAPVAVHVKAGAAECLQTEFRPRAQEAVSRAAGWGGRTSFRLNSLSTRWRATAQLEDPCDVVGRGALAWSLRNDCRAEDRGDGSYWIPMWARWCREGWGTMGYALPEVYDAAGNRATDFANEPVRVNNARARDVAPARAEAGDVIVRAPVVLAGKNAPSVAVAGQKVPMNVAPSVVELYAEPSAFTWNMYRRVVAAGQYVVFHFYFDQPALRVRLWIGNDGPRESLVKHENIAPAYKVHKPCANNANLDAWLARKGLVALTETVAHPGTFDSDDDFLDAQINALHDSRVSDGNGGTLPCRGFWVLKGDGNFRVKRLCVKRKVLTDQAGVTENAQCSDTEDRVYVTSRGYNYHVAKVTLTDDMMSGGNQPDGPLRIKWQIQSAWNSRWGPETWSDTGTAGFFHDAQNGGADVAAVTSRVGDGFDASKSCNRDATANYDQPGSSVWVAKDSTPPATLTAADVTVSVSSPQADAHGTELIASRGDVVTVKATFDEQIDPDDAPAFYTATGRRVLPSQVYYNVVTYELVVGTTIPATDGLLDLTIGPVSDVVGNAQSTGFQTTVFGADGTTVTIQSVRSSLALYRLSDGWFDDYQCETTTDNPLDDGVAGPTHTFTLTLKAKTPLAVASATVAGASSLDASSGVAVALSDNTDPTPDVTNGTVTVTRTVPADGAGFVDGATVNWNLALTTTTTCLSGSGTCLIAFEVNRCPDGAVPNAVDGVVTVTSWERKVVVDLTRPTITSLLLASATNPDEGPVVRDSERAKVRFVASEPLAVSGPNPPNVRLVTEDCSGAIISAVTATTLVAGTDSTYEVVGNVAVDDTALGGATCEMSRVCVQIPSATDRGENALVNDEICNGFGALLTNAQPGWLFFDNAVAPSASALTLEKVPASCADSSVGSADCLALSTATPLGPGSWFKAQLRAATLTAVRQVSFGDGTRVTHRTRVPPAGSDLVLEGCVNAAPATECEAYASRRGACEAFLCPDCAFRHSCDESCGYCQTGRGVATEFTAYLSTSDFPSLAAGSSADLNVTLVTAGKVAADVVSATTLAYADHHPATSLGLDNTNSCAGRCGGAAPSGCSCEQDCVSSGDCCADAGLCCDPGDPLSGASEPAGGCLLPPAVTLATEVESWSERDDGVTSDLAGPGSTVYVRVTANKPIEVLSAVIGGVTVNVNDVAVEYESGALALERSAVAAGRDAMSEPSQDGFVTARANLERARASLPVAALPYEADAHVREYPDIPDTRSATIRVDGQALVPQPDGAISYVVELVEKSHNPFYTDGWPVTSLTGNGPEWRNTPVVVSISGTKSSGAGPSGVVSVGGEVEVTIAANVEVVVTSFVIHSYPLTCKGSEYGGDAHGDCVADPRIVPADPSNLAEYRDTWVGTRAFAEKERLSIESGPLRACVAVVDAAGNRGSTCAELADVEVDVEPPAFLATPTVVGRTATSIDVLVEMSEPGKASWRPLHECQTGQASSTCDVKTGNVANAPTGDAAIPNAPTPTVITIPVNAAWLDGPGDGVVQIEWEICDAAENCGPGNPATQDVLLPPSSAVLPTLVPTIVKVNESQIVVDLAHGDGGDQACWAVLVMTEPATAATAPPRTVAQTCDPVGVGAGLFTSPLWCGGASQAHACPQVSADSTESGVVISQLTSETPYCLYTSPRGADPGDDAAVLCVVTADDTPPTFTTIRGVSTGCQGDKIVGPSCGMTILVIADECVTEPNVTLTYTATGEADAAALPVAERPTTTIRSDGSSSSAAASCGTRWTYTYSPGWAPHLPSGNLTIRVGDCFDRAPFGAGAAADSDVSPNACPTETSWIGADTRHVVIDNTPPAPVTVTLTREDDGNACPAGGVGGGEVVWITVDFDETTSRPTFTCLGNAVPSSSVTIPGSTPTNTTAYSDEWRARCVVPPNKPSGAFTYTFTHLADRYGNEDDTVFDEASDAPANPCPVKSSKPILTLADFDVFVVKPGGQVVLTLETSEVVDTPTVGIAGDAIAAANVVPDSPDSDGRDDRWTVTHTIPADTPDGPLAFSVSELTDAHGNVNPREYVRPVGFGSDRPLVDGRAPTLRLIEYVSDNAMDRKLGIPGDVLRLTFEADELVSAPTVTVGGATATVTHATRAGTLARGFVAPTTEHLGAYSATWIAEVTLTTSSTPESGEIPWSATGFSDIAQNAGGVGERCDDWLPGCDAVYATQLADDRFANPAIDASTGLPVTTFRDEDFVALAEADRTTVWTPYHGNATVATAARVNEAGGEAIRAVMALHHPDVGMWYYAQYISTAHLLWQHGGACGAANEPNCRAACAACDDDPVTSRVGEDVDAVNGNLTVDGNGTLGGDCTPTVKDGDVATWYVGVLDGREVTKPGVRFTDAAGSVFVVPESAVVPADPDDAVYKPDVPPSPCAGTTDDPRVGDGVCHPSLNVAPCFDGGDCCEETCAGDACGTGGDGYECVDRGVDPVTGLPAPGAWATYNAAIAAAWTLAPAWKVELTLDAAAMGVGDGLITGEVCCMRDGANSDPLGADFDWVPHAVAGNECLAATVNNHPGEVLEAEIVTGTGLDVVSEGTDVTLVFTVSGVPSTTPTCEIAGVATGDAVRVDNDAGDADDLTAVNSTWHCDRPTLTETDPQLEPLIREQQAALDPDDIDASAADENSALVNPCAVGVVVRWNVRFRDAAGSLIETDALQHPNANIVCFDYDKPDVTRIVQDTTGNPGWAKSGDDVTLTVIMDRAVVLPTDSTLGGDPCTPAYVGSDLVAYECVLNVVDSTPEGPVELLVEGMVAMNGTGLPTVNYSYANVWPAIIADDNGGETPNRPVVVDVTPPTFEKFTAESETGTDPKQCGLCCRLRIDIEMSEDTTEPSINITGVSGPTIDVDPELVVGSDSVWSAVVELCNSTAPPDGVLTVCVENVADPAGNVASTCTHVGPEDGDDDPVIRTSDVAPLRAALYSDRPGYNWLGMGGEDTLYLALDMSGNVTIDEAVIGPASSTTSPPNVSWAVHPDEIAAGADGSASRWLASAAVMRDWGEIDPVPWSITYRSGGSASTVSSVTGPLPTDPAWVRVDVTPPTITFLNVTSDSPKDPVASNPWTVSICFETSEPVQTPEVVLTGETLAPAMLSGGGTRWCAGPRVVLPADIAHTDDNKCVTFAVTLTDLAGNVAEPITALIGAEGSDNCPTTRVELDLAPPVFLWLQTNTITSTDMTFDVALNEFARVFYVAVPEGSAEPTPDEVVAGFGSGGAAAVSAGFIDYRGSDTPSPAVSGGGLGMVLLTVPYLSQGFRYDLYFTARDDFGQTESEARARRLASLGVWTPAGAILVGEAGDTDVIVLELTQPPTADVTVRLHTTISGHEDQLLFAEEANQLVYADDLTVTFPRESWSVPIEVKVKAVDDPVVEGTHTAQVALTVASDDPRYDDLPMTPVPVTVVDNDVAAVVIADPREAPQLRVMVCDGQVPPSALSYTTDEATAVDALVWLTGAPPGSDEVVVELRSSDANWMTLFPASASGVTTIRFDRLNYDRQVPIRLVPVYSDVADPDRTVYLETVVSSVSAPYASVVVPDIPVTIVDLQTPGIVFSRTEIREGAGMHFITLRLESEPTADVTVRFTVLQDAEGAYQYANLRPIPDTLTFEPADFGTPESVAFVIQDDGTYYGDVQFDVQVSFTSLDVQYANLVPPPLVVTALEGDPLPGWFVADSSGFNRLSAAPDDTPLTPPTIREQSGALRYSIRPTGTLWKEVTIEPTFAPGTKQRGVFSPQSHTFRPGSQAPAHFTLRFPSNHAVLGDHDVTIWHVVVGDSDEPGYRDLNPNLGGGELVVTLLENDVADFNLGNGATGLILLEEPASASSPPVTNAPGSFGVVLGSKPLGTVQLSIFEAVNGTNFENPTAIPRRRSLLSGDPVAPADRQVTLVSGQTLTFTELDWFVPHEVVMYANYRANNQGKRVVQMCSTITSPDDPVYAGLDAPCFNLVVTEFGDRDAPAVDNPDGNIEVEVIEVRAEDALAVPRMFQRFTKFWKVQTYNLDGSGVRLSGGPHDTTGTLAQPINVTFSVDVNEVASRNGTNVMWTTYPDLIADWVKIVDPDVYWSDVVDAQNMTNVTVTITELGSYFLGEAFPALRVLNPSTGPLFVEKGPASSMFAGLTIVPGDDADNYPVRVTKARLKLKEYFNPETDLVNLTGCANVTIGCFVGPTENVYAIYFPLLGELTLMPWNEAPPPASGRRRRLLSTPEDPTTDDYAAILDGTSFSDSDVAPLGNSRTAEVQVQDNNGGTATGPELTLPTEPVNDIPNVVTNPFSLTYIEKESTLLDNMVYVYDVDSPYITRAEIDLYPEYEDGDALIDAVEERKQLYANNVPPRALPDGLDNITSSITTYSSTSNPGERNRVTITGIAPPEAYTFVFRSIKFQNNGPLITNVRRRIVFRVWDDLDATNDVPDPDEAMVSTRIMNLVNVNDPPVAARLQTTLTLSTPGATGIGQMIAYDLDSPTIWFNITCLPGKGNVTITDVNTGEYSYTHDPDKPGTDTFVFFAWDGELSSKFATVTVRTGSGVASPVATDLTLEVWENSPTLGTMPATDDDGPADIYRYQVTAEPSSPSSLTLEDEVLGLFRHCPAGRFTYTALSSSTAVARVAQAMSDLPDDFDFNAVRGTSQHPGYRADSFKFKVLDISGKVSGEATVWINIRLTRERNTPPQSFPLGGATFTTAENVALSGSTIKFLSQDNESPNNLRHEILVTAAGTTPVFDEPKYGVISPFVATDPHDPRFVYTPHPFFHGVENLRYYAIDAHGAKSDPVDLRIEVTEVNQAPFGACAADSPMDDDIKTRLGAGTEFSVVAADVADVRDAMRVRANEDIGTLREQFVSYEAAIAELDAMTPTPGNESLAVACGDVDTKIRMLHDDIVAVVLMAFDVDNLAGGRLSYTLKSTPTHVADGSAAGEVHAWRPPNLTEIPSVDAGVNSTFEYRFVESDFTNATRLDVGDAIPGDVPLVVFRPRARVHGEVTFTWAARDPLGAEGAPVSTTFKVQCPGGEAVDGWTCRPCPPGQYNDRVLVDQTSCTDCPAGTQTPVPGSTRCAACPADTYSDQSGVGVCPSCPDRMKSYAGANTLELCQCEIGTVQLTSTQCWPCDLVRTKCDALGRVLPIPYAGHWTDPNDPTRTHDCIPGAACLEKVTEDEVRDRRCAGQRFAAAGSPVAYVGDGCYECQDEHYRHAGHCHHCGGYQERRWRLSMLVILYMILVGCLIEVAGSKAVGSLGIFITFVQITASFKYLSISWPKSIYAWFTATSVSYLDMELWSVECIYPESWTFFAKYRMAVFQPLIWVAVLCGSILLRVLRRVLMEYVRRGRRAIQTRILATRRWLHQRVDPDAKAWKDLADERLGEPLDKDELRDPTDVYNEAEQLDLTNKEFDRAIDYAKQKGLDTEDEKDDGRLKFRYLVLKYTDETIHRAIPTCMLCFQWGYYLLCQSAIKFFECEDNNVGELRLRADPTVICYQGAHSNHLALAIVSLLVYPFGMLAFGFYFVWHFRDDGPHPRVFALNKAMSDAKDPKTLDKIRRFERNFGLLYGDARKPWVMWHVVDMGKRLGAVLIRALVSYPISQTLLIMSLLMGVALLTAKARPYRMWSLNAAEQVACNINVVVLVFGYFFQLGVWTEGITRVMAGICIFIIAVTLLVLLFFISMDLFPWIRRFVQMVLHHAESQDEELVRSLETHVSGPQGYALFVIPPSSSFRRRCWEMVHSSLFDRYIIVAIVMSTVITFVELVPLAPGPEARINVINDFFTVTFAAEAVLKIISLGFVLGEHAYLRDTFNCLDFAVVLMSLILWIAENGGDALGGIRSARFFKYLKFLKLKYIRFLRIGLRLRSMTGGHLAAIYRKAIEPDTIKIKEVMEKARLVFDEQFCDSVYGNLRSLPPELADSAVSLVEEFFREGYDAESVMMVSQQLHAVRHNVNKEHLEMVYEWLAFHARHKEKIAFLDAMIYSRDFMATVGEKAMREKIRDGGPYRSERYRMSTAEANFSRATANELRRRKNVTTKTRSAKREVSDRMAKHTVEDYDSEESDSMRGGVVNAGATRGNNHPGMRHGENRNKLRHGHGVDSTWRSIEDRLADNEVDYEGERQVKAFDTQYDGRRKRN